MKVADRQDSGGRAVRLTAPHAGLVDLLLALGARIDRTNFFPTLATGATEFALADPFAFVLACCLDRGAKTERIWTVPFDLFQRLGHLDPARIATMTLHELASAVVSLPRKPRYVQAAPATIRSLADLVVREYHGDAKGLWAERSARRLKRSLRQVRGVGPHLANMTVLLVERAFGVRFVDKAEVDLKADVHTIRVTYRLGLADAEDADSAVAAARLLHPPAPGDLDAPLWMIGRTWCATSSPNCHACIAKPNCARVGLPR